MVKTIVKDNSKESKNGEDNVCHILSIWRLSIGGVGLCGKPEKCNKPYNSKLAKCRCGKDICPNCLYLKNIRGLPERS